MEWRDVTAVEKARVVISIVFFRVEMEHTGQIYLVREMLFGKLPFD